MNKGTPITVLGIPTWAEDCALDNYDTDYNNDAPFINELRAAAAARKWIGLCTPQTGRGKTHLAIAAMHLVGIRIVAAACELIHDNGETCDNKGPYQCAMHHRTRGIDILRFAPQDWIFIRGDRLAHELAMAGINFEKRYEHYANHNLIIDELGRNVTDKGKQEIIQMLIYDLFDGGKKLIFTSPFTKETLPLDPSVLDRMKEGFIRNLPAGKSYRRAQ